MGILPIISSDQVKFTDGNLRQLRITNNNIGGAMRQPYGPKVRDGQRLGGVTLIELMTVVAIMGILTAIAYPSYQQHVAKGRRAGAQAVLMDIAQRQQQYLLDARSYASDLATLGVSPPNDVAAYYTVSVALIAGPPPGFSATATPKAGTAQANDPVLTIDNAGVKTPVGKW
jgi:type IV pilus assembly protein PilE